MEEFGEQTRRTARLRHHAGNPGEDEWSRSHLAATLYGTLQRLIADGLIEESDERPVELLDDARRRYYRLTRLGRKVLELEGERLQEMIRMMQKKRVFLWAGR